MDESFGMNVSMAEYVEDGIDDLLKKACVNERGQKTLIKTLYSRRRDEVASECSEAAASVAIVSRVFLSTSEGRKLAGDFVSRFGVEWGWQRVRRAIERGAMTRGLGQLVGQVFGGLWKRLEGEEEGDGGLRGSIEHVFFEGMVDCGIFYPLAISEIFHSMLDGILHGNPSHELAQALYVRVNPFVWRVLSAPDDICRYNAAVIFLKLYPMEAPYDDLTREGLTEKVQAAFEALLMDESFAIRIVAIKAVFRVLSLFWPLVRAPDRKKLLALVIDKLSLDSVADVRLAILEAFPPLLACGAAFAVAEHAAKILAKRVLTDPADKVRIAGFKLFRKLTEHGMLLQDVVPIDELLVLIDIDDCADVRDAATSLIWAFCDFGSVKTVIDRLKKVEALIRVSPLATLFIHQYIYKMKLVTLEEAVTHMLELTVALASRLKFRENVNETNQSTILSTTVDESRVGVDFNVVKTAIDSIIVLWNSIRIAVIRLEDQRLNTKATRMLTKFAARLFDNRYAHTILNESAYGLAALLPATYDLAPKRKEFIDALRTGDLDDEATILLQLRVLAMWDVPEVFAIIDQGLGKLASELKVPVIAPKVTRGNLFLRHGGAYDNTRDKFRRPLLFLHGLLTAPLTSSYLRREFTVILGSYRASFASALEAKPVEIENERIAELWAQVEEVHSLLCIGVVPDAENNDAEEEEEAEAGDEQAAEVEGENDE